MKNLSKFKIYLKAGNVLDLFPRRIKRFHRTKWKFIVKKFRRKLRTTNSVLKQKYKRRPKYIKKRKRSFRFLKVSSPTFLKKKIFRMKKYLKESIRSKNKFLQVFDNSFKPSILKKDLSKEKKVNNKEILKLLLIKQIYFINVLLWKLHFFSSSNEASSYVDNNHIKVNGKKVRSNYFLKLGDVLEFEDLALKLRLKQNLHKYIKLRKVYPFVEIDYYTCTVIIVKNYDDFIVDDLSLFFPKKINTSSTYNMLK